MTAKDLMIEVATAIVNNTQLQQWCVAIFGQGLYVFVGIDTYNPPKNDYWPLVAVTDVSEMKSDDRKYQRFSLKLGSGVLNETLTETGMLSVYDGIIQAEELRTKVESALFASNIGHTIEIASASSGESFHPHYVSYSDIYINILLSSRRAVR